MSTTWKLQEWLKSKRGVTRPTDISKIILKTTGFKISNQAISDLFNTQPKILRLETIQAICDTFNCRLTDFCVITPDELPSPTGLTKTGTTKKKVVTKLRALSSNLEQLKQQLGLISTSEAAQLCTSSLQGINSLVNTGRIRHEILLDHTYVYKNDVLSTPVRKGRPTATHQPRPQTNPTPITLFLHPYSVRTNEDLRSFLSRIQFAAITRAIEVEGSISNAAHRLHYTRPSLTTLRRRLRSKGITTSSSSATTHQPRRPTTILLPRSLFTIKETEGLQTFIARIQLATIIKTIEVEGNKAKAAVRLGYRRTSFLTLLRLLTVGSRSLKNL
jgi:putative transcriptional regulator